MGFLNPALLAGFALVSVPILLHLLLRQRPRQLPFPALRFVTAKFQATSRRLRLRHLLLLLARVAIVSLLVLVLARPTWKPWGKAIASNEPVSAVLLFDTSVRMDYVRDEKTRLDRAKQLARWIIRRLPQDSQLAVVTTSPGALAFQVDRAQALEKLDRLSTSCLSASLSERLYSVLSLFEKAQWPNRELYIFTDMARVAWPQLSAQISQQLKNTKDLSLYVIDVGVEEINDTGLSLPALSSEVAATGETIRVRAELEQWGIARQCNVEVLLRKVEPTTGDKAAYQSRGKETVNLEKGRATVEFSLNEAEVGFYQGIIHIEQPDALTWNNKRYFTFQVRPPWQVLLAAPVPAEQYTFFLRQMLSPIAFERLKQQRFDCQVIELGRLDEVELEQYDAVMLVDPDQVPPSTWAKLESYLASGGGLGIFLGRNADLQSLASDVVLRLMPGRLIRQVRRPDGVFLLPQRFDHPVLVPFKQWQTQLPWQTGPVFRYWQIELDGRANVVISFSDGNPAVVERLLPKGRLLVMLTPVSDPPALDAWNLFSAGDCWPCLALVHQMGQYLCSAGSVQLNQLVGRSVLLPLPKQLAQADSTSRTGRADYRALLLDSPVARQASLILQVTKNGLQSPPVPTVGNWIVRMGSDRLRAFSTNLPTEQTRLDRISPEELRKQLGIEDLQVVRNEQQIHLRRTVRQTGIELFEPLAWLLVITLVVEYLLANRFYATGASGKKPLGEVSG